MTFTHKTKKMRSAFLLALLLGTALSTPAHADVNWTGNTDTNWFDDSNWDTAEPISTEIVYINTTNNAPVINASGAVGANTYVGNSADGAMTVTGSSADYTTTRPLYVGFTANGLLNILDGGTVDSSTSSVGRLVSSTSTVNVSGTGSNWQAGYNIVMGYNGSGALNISNGSLVAYTGTGYLGERAGSTGSATVSGTGSTLSSTGDLLVGSLGTGTLTVDNGGTVSTRIGRVAYGIASSGTATVTGAGSTWTNSSYLRVGESGNGTLNILDGGAVSNNSSGSIGYETGATGLVTISGTGSQWTNSSGGVYIGHTGNGTLNIENGGLLNFTTTSYAGYTIGSTGTVTITGANSTATSVGDIVFSYNGESTLNITDGGTLDVRIGRLGYQAGSTATGVVSGAGSNWTNSSSLYVGNGGNGTLTVTDGGAITASDITIADGVTSTSVLNIGAESGETEAAAGSITASTITFGSGVGSLILNHTDLNYTLASDISGAGLIAAENGVTNLTGDLSGFTGSSTISDSATLNITNSYGGSATVNNGGTITANNTVSGTIIVNSGGTLKGSGTIGGAVVNSGGIMAPGNSIGTLNVAGNVSFASGSFFDVEVDADGNSDLTHATGTATITGGTVRLTPELPTDTYAVGSPYTILTADSGVTGTFDGATVNSLFYSPTLTYDANNVYATIIRNATSYSSLAQTFNERGVAAALDAAPSTAAANAVGAQGSDTAVRFALDNLSGELHANIKGSIIENDSAFASVVNSQEEPGYWATYHGSWNTHSGGARHEFNSDTHGLAFGYKQTLGNSSEVGVAFGYDRSSYNQTAVLGNRTEGTANHYRAAAQAKHAQDNLTLKGNAHYAYHAVDTTRRVVFPSYDETHHADYDGHSIVGFAEAAYAINVAPEIKLEPFTNITYGYATLGAFNETGSAGLRSDGDSYTAGASTLGTRIHYGFELEGTPSVFKAELGWKHHLGASTPEGSYAFAGSPSFQSRGTKLLRNAVDMKASVDMYLSDDLKIGLSYAGTHSDALSSHTIQTGLKYSF